MDILSNLTVKQLKQAIKIREKMEILEGKLSQLAGGNDSTATGVKKTWTMSPAARAKIAAAQRARWAKLKGSGAETTAKPKRKMSAAARAAISAAAKARWKKAKAAGKTTL